MFLTNQHQILVRRLFHISQTTSVEDYIQRFSELVDQITAYEPRPDPVQYTSRFLDGLKPTVRVLVAIQQPTTLESAYSLALLYEELGDGSTPMNSPSTPISTSWQAQATQPPFPPPPSKWISRTVEEKRAAEQHRNPGDDKWNSLKTYRCSKGLCFIYSEKWSREHECKQAISLHVV